MNIVFPPVDAGYIKSMVSNGYFTNATELVRHAVRRLREEEDKKRDRLMAALEEGERDIREGRFEPYTPELLDEIEREVDQHIAEGKSYSYDPDVCGE